ncbi:hypothetical protein AX17_000553 [Amanita inopinata Kibby_2008]|nr:hypothetical protein AX17_000553 [Amanita inopinata Kibby_2008]
MFRTTLVRAVKPTLKPGIANAVLGCRSTLAVSMRFNSSQPTPQTKQAIKEAIKKNDDLQRDWDARILTYAELKPKTQNPTPNTYLVDVREPDEVIQGMIPSAVNLPLSVLGDSLHLSREAFKAKHGFEKPKKDEELIFYCRSGVRSTSASDVAKRNGFANVQNYKGSWLEWVEKESKKPT